MLRGYFLKSQKVRQDYSQIVHLCSFVERCSECSTWSRLVYNETNTIWILDDSALDSNVVDIQCIVECANASETVMLPTNGTLIPNGTITIDKPLTITGFYESVPISEDTYPSTESKAAISCPEGSDQGIFNIQYKDLAFD